MQLLLYDIIESNRTKRTGALGDSPSLIFPVAEVGLFFFLNQMVQVL
jgi:hypothetical protein